MKLKVTDPINVDILTTHNNVNRWGISVFILHEEKRIIFEVSYINKSEATEREIIKGMRRFEISGDDYNLFWNFSDPTLNLGQAFRKRVIQTFKNKSWIPSEAEEE